MSPRPAHRSAAPPLLVPHRVDARHDDDRRTPGVLLLDGPPGTPFVWRRVLRVLRRRGVAASPVKRADRPAVTGQEADPFAAAAEIADLLDDELREPAVIVGHGPGVGVAMALAVIAPRHVRALVLVAPAPDVAPIRLTDRVLAAPILGPTVACLGFRVAGLVLHVPAARRAVLTREVGVQAGDDKPLVHEIAFGALWRSFARAQRSLVRDARRRNRQLRRIGCPVVILAGRPDGPAARRSGRTLRRWLPGAEVMATATAAHLIPIVDPECVADAVVRAVRQQITSP